jgi:hypothetical protein
MLDLGAVGVFAVNSLPHVPPIVYFNTTSSACSPLSQKKWPQLGGELRPAYLGYAGRAGRHGFNCELIRSGCLSGSDTHGTDWQGRPFT